MYVVRRSGVNCVADISFVRIDGRRRRSSDLCCCGGREALEYSRNGLYTYAKYVCVCVFVFAYNYIPR